MSFCSLRPTSAWSAQLPTSGPPPPQITTFGVKNYTSTFILQGLHGISQESLGWWLHHYEVRYRICNLLEIIRFLTVRHAIWIGGGDGDLFWTMGQTTTWVHGEQKGALLQLESWKFPWNNQPKQCVVYGWFDSCMSEGGNLYHFKSVCHVGRQTFRN